MTTGACGPQQRKPLEAGTFRPAISSFRLHLAAEAKTASTVRTYTDAVRWFAAAHLIPHTSHGSWEERSAAARINLSSSMFPSADR